MYTLENERYRARIKRHGAELISLIDRQTDKEWMWQGDRTYWGRHAPVLFPVVGTLKNGTYCMNGEAYSLPRHGFARDSQFDVIEHGNTKVVFRLCSSQQTREVYPFDFTLDITYTLTEKALEVSYLITNGTDQTMPFSIGGHPAFNIDLNQTDWQLRFEQPETLELQLLDIQTGLLSGETLPFVEDETTVNLHLGLFDIDTLIFKNYQSAYIDAVHRQTGEGIRLHCADFPYFGVWTPNAPFLCLEPWHGVADPTDASGDLMEKPGIRPLPPKGQFRCVYGIEVLNEK